MADYDYDRELQVAIAAVREAATLCRAVQATITPDVLEKKDRSPVTIADFGSQAIVCRALLEAFPDDPVIAEEDAAELRLGSQNAFLNRVRQEVEAAGIECTRSTVCDWIDHGGAHRYSDRFWTLDPIDGTKGFLRGEQYAISLALIVDGQITLAVLGCPNLPLDDAATAQAEPVLGNRSPGSLFHAVHGRGSTCTALDDSANTPVQVSRTSDASAARFCESVESGHSSHSLSADVAATLGITRDPVRMDSQAKYATVARGAADIYLRLPTRKNYNEKIWDHAGGVLVVTEAGGRVTDIHGRELDFTQGAELTRNQGVIVSNGHVHDAVLDALRANGVR